MMCRRGVEYWFGAASWNDTVSYLLDNKTLYAIDSDDVLTGAAPPTKIAVPYDSSGVPAARMAQNGARVEGVGICFYSADPSSLVCYSPEHDKFGQFPCSVTHVAGAIAAVNRTVFVAGGADVSGNATAVVEVFHWPEEL